MCSCVGTHSKVQTKMTLVLAAFEQTQAHRVLYGRHPVTIRPFGEREIETERSYAVDVQHLKWLTPLLACSTAYFGASSMTPASPVLMSLLFCQWGSLGRAAFNSELLFFTNKRFCVCVVETAASELTFKQQFLMICICVVHNL